MLLDSHSLRKQLCCVMTGTSVFLACFYLTSRHQRNFHTKPEIIDKQHALESKLHTELITRLQTLNQVCLEKQGNHTSSKISIEIMLQDAQYFLDRSRKLLYCRLAKVASRNWKRVFVLLTNASHADTIFSSNKDLNKINIPSLHKKENMEFQSLFKFTFVRNPWTRLISAFIDKAYTTANWADVLKDRRNFGQPLANARVFIFLTTLRHKEGNEKEALSTQKWFPFIEKSKKKHDRANPNMTFLEFLRYVEHDNKRGHANRHWRPQSDICHVCDIHWDFLGKFENLGPEANLLLKEHVSSDRKITFPSFGSANSMTKEEEDNKLKAFYSDIPTEMIDTLRKIFHWDFKLFGYPNKLPFE